MQVTFDMLRCLITNWGEHFWICRQSGPQDPHVDNLMLRDGKHECSVASSETSVLYLQVPKVRCRCPSRLASMLELRLQSTACQRLCTKALLLCHICSASAQDMQGGHLTIFEADSDDNLAPSRHIQAEQNLLVRFRGSAPHRYMVLPMHILRALPCPAQQGKAWCVLLRHRVHKCKPCTAACLRPTESWSIENPKQG